MHVEGEKPENPGRKILASEQGDNQQWYREYIREKPSEQDENRQLTQPT